MRLNRFIASCGVSSRRAADKLILEGRVTVNGAAATAGPDIDENKDIVCIDGRRITPGADNVYIMLNKPAGVISSCADDRGRKTVVDLVKGIDERLFPVGRLDYDTEGLLILTNDGDLSFKCTHPRHEVEKKYIAQVKGPVDDNAIGTLSAGVVIDGRKTSEAKIEVQEKNRGSAVLSVTIHEGRNRQVKKMFERVGCTVTHLKRISIGGLELGDLPAGKWRRLTPEEIKLLCADDMH